MKPNRTMFYLWGSWVLQTYPTQDSRMQWIILGNKIAQWIENIEGLWD
jgi:hypothetical protein